VVVVVTLVSMGMYRLRNQPEFTDFYLPFGGKLDPENRWVKLAKLVSWHFLEEDYRTNFDTPRVSSAILTGSCIEIDRIAIEGKFGNAKHKGPLQRVMAKLAVTSRTVVTIGLIALNLDALLRFLRALIEHHTRLHGMHRAKRLASPPCCAAFTWIYRPDNSAGTLQARAFGWRGHCRRRREFPSWNLGGLIQEASFTTARWPTSPLQA